MVIEEGQPGDELFVLLAGDMEVTKGGNVLTTLKAGVHLGEMAMIDNAPRSASVRALTDANLLIMRRDDSSASSAASRSSPANSYGAS